MNAKVIDLLKSKDPSERKQGIMLAGRSGEKGYIGVLQKLATIEPDPYLKSLTEKTVEYLGRESTKPKETVIKPLAASQPVVIKRDTSDEVDFTKLKRREAPRSKPRYTPGKMAMLVLFAIFVIGVAVVFLQYQLFGSLPWVMVAMSNAKTFPVEGRAPDVLTGEVYQRYLNSYTTYTIFEPKGQTPPDGWPLLLVNHGWGMQAEQMAALYYQWAQDEGVLLIATQFDNEQEASNNFYRAFRNVNHMMDELEAYYPVNVHANIIMGFSWGGNMSYFYTHTYPRMFSGAVLVSAPPYPLPPINSEVKYIVFAGENEGWEDQSLGHFLRQLAGELGRRGTPLWYWEVHDGGHEITPGVVEQTKALMAELRGN